MRARATDPEERPDLHLTSTGGTVSGIGETATFNAAGVRAGSYTVTATVDTVKTPVQHDRECSERLSVSYSGFRTGRRVDNCAKAILDDLAVRMKNDPTLMPMLSAIPTAARDPRLWASAVQKRWSPTWRNRELSLPG